MKPSQIVIIAILLLFCVLPIAVGQNCSGIYKTDFNELTLLQTGNTVSGSYKYADGKIEGTIEGNVLTGWWYQNNGKGRLRFVFTENWTEFKGLWSYDEAVPSKKWDGTRTGGIEMNYSGAYKTDFNELTIHQVGNRVTGSYNYMDGRIEGEINGNILTGWWYQSNGKGRLRFVFVPDKSGFKGLWGYSEAEPDKKWDGVRN